LTRRYFDMMQKADADLNINFHMHCVELYDDVQDPQHASPLSGEIGFSIGKIYTSLSGWTEERTAEGTGTTQLVLLGRWLQQKGYSFWSLGHCYSPAMDYKRQLGHRIFPRTNFLALLKQHRGEFRKSSSIDRSSSSSSSSSSKDEGGTAGFSPLEKGETIDCESLVLMQGGAALVPPPPWTLTKMKTKKKSGGFKKVKPNEPCVCGSGKKFKKCCR